MSKKKFERQVTAANALQTEQFSNFRKEKPCEDTLQKVSARPAFALLEGVDRDLFQGALLCMRMFYSQNLPFTLWVTVRKIGPPPAKASCRRSRRTSSARRSSAGCNPAWQVGRGSFKIRSKYASSHPPLMIAVRRLWPTLLRTESADGGQGRSVGVHRAAKSRLSPHSLTSTVGLTLNNPPILHIMAFSLLSAA